MKTKEGIIVKKLSALMLIAILLVLPVGCVKQEEPKPPAPPLTTAGNGEETTATTTTTTSTTTTTTAASSLSKAEAQKIAEAKVDLYWKTLAFGVCCDIEYAEGDMSGFLSGEQLENYPYNQWRITCCHNAAEVKAHLRHHFADGLIYQQPDKDLFYDDQNNFYIMVPACGFNGHRTTVKTFSDTRITAICEELEMGEGDIVCATYNVTLEKRNGEFILVNIR